MKLIKDINIGYGKRLLYNNFTLKIHKGITILASKNGVGKSSLLLYIFNEQPLKCMYMPQDFDLALINWMKVKNYLGKKGVNLLDEFFPQGSKKFKNSYISSLSGGWRQIIALCKILSKHTNIFLLDEPTSAMDIENKIKAQKMIVHISQSLKKDIILVSHDPHEIYHTGDYTAILSNSPVVMKALIKNNEYENFEQYNQIFIECII